MEGDLDVLDCMKWVRIESKITTMTGRLQNHKASLTAISTILGCSVAFSLAFGYLPSMLT